MSTKNRGLRSLIYSKYDSEAEMARTMGWARQRLSKITNGDKIPDVFELDDLAKALDTSMSKIAPLFLPKESPNEQRNAEKI